MAPAVPELTQEATAVTSYDPPFKQISLSIDLWLTRIPRLKLLIWYTCSGLGLRWYLIDVTEAWLRSIQMLSGKSNPRVIVVTAASPGHARLERRSRSKLIDWYFRGCRQLTGDTA
jgi:hypothetical protein